MLPNAVREIITQWPVTGKLSKPIKFLTREGVLKFSKHCEGDIRCYAFQSKDMREVVVMLINVNGRATYRVHVENRRLRDLVR